MTGLSKKLKSDPILAPYMLKIIVADSDDPWFDSICLLEKGGVRIDPYMPN